MMLYWYEVGTAWKFSLTFAHFWTFVDYLCYSTQLVGFGYASVERHILIFHSNWVSTKKKQFFVHYLPVTTVLIYSILYYVNIRQKSRMSRSVEWSKQRKMTIQLLSISTLYFIFMGPRTLLQFCRFLDLETNDILWCYTIVVHFLPTISCFFSCLFVVEQCLNLAES